MPGLPPCPDAAFDPATYRARTGTWAGVLDEVRWGYYRGWLHGQVRRALIRKRWFDVSIRTDDTVFVVRLQDDGTTGHGRIAAVDRHTGGVRAQAHGVGAPLRTLVVGFMAARGTEAFLHAPGLDITFDRGASDTAWSLRVAHADLAIEATLDTADAPTPVATIGEAHPPWTHRPGLTQHHPALTVSGAARLGGRPIDLAKARASVSYTNAFLAPVTHRDRVTAEGALPDGRRLALAAASGPLLGALHEGVVWLDGEPTLLPEPHILVDDRTPGRWRITSTDGRLDLVGTADARLDAFRHPRVGRVDHRFAWRGLRLSGSLPVGDEVIAVDDLDALGTRLRLRG